MPVTFSTMFSRFSSRNTYLSISKCRDGKLKRSKNYFLLKSLLKQSASQLSAQTGMFSEIPGNSVKSLDWKVPCAALQSSLVAMSHILSDETHFNFSTFQQRLFSRSPTWTKGWTYSVHEGDRPILNLLY